MLSWKTYAFLQLICLKQESDTLSEFQSMWRSYVGMEQENKT